MSIDIQNKIKRNALEIREYVTDLYDWEQEMELKEKAKRQLRKEEKSKSEEDTKIIKQSQAQTASKAKAKQEIIVEKQSEQKKDLLRDVNTVGQYYKAWDKFDIDKELTKLEQEEQRPYRPYNPYEDSKTNLRAKPKTKININGRRQVVSDPTQLKDKGNMHFQSLQFEKAINYYTECLNKMDEENQTLQNMSEQRKKLRCVVLSNRSMAYLKIQETSKALHDANQSLVYNDKYSKSYYRRAECLKKIGKYKESLQDFKMVRTLEPQQTKADKQIKKIQAFLQKRCKQAKQSMIIEYNPSLLTDGRRVDIDQVNQFAVEVQAHSVAKASNYLQQL